MDALIASFPILLVVVSMLGFGLPAKTALPLGWLATLAVAPLIGVLGAFMSGSNTVSNMLFAPLQFETAALVKLSPSPCWASSPDGPFVCLKCV